MPPGPPAPVPNGTTPPPNLTWDRVGTMFLVSVAGAVIMYLLVSLMERRIEKKEEELEEELEEEEEIGRVY
ncbi:hypothetical protein [Thermococcus sp.]